MSHMQFLTSTRRLQSVLGPRVIRTQSAPKPSHDGTNLQTIQPSRFIALLVTSMVTLGVGMPALASNDAILSKLGQLKDEETSKEIASPVMSRLSRVQAAREQFGRVGRLVQLEQFNSARLQLREGAASTLRKDLRDAQDLYITEQMATNSIEALQQLDVALKAQDTDSCKQQLEVLQQSLQLVIDALDSPLPTP